MNMMRHPGFLQPVRILLALCIASATSSPAQIFTTLATFDFTNGDAPFGPLVQGTDGNFYGTTYGGGKGNSGTLFKITPAGAVTTVHSFCAKRNCADGSLPGVSLVQGTDGNFYGTTLLGGKNAGGTVFKLTAKGKLTTIYNFCSQPNCTDGDRPLAGIVQGADGALYGTTAAGGTGQSAGTVFRITTKGNLITLYSFCSQQNCADGQEPLAALAQATDGSFYGTTQYGGVGAGQSGTIFKITSEGAFSTLYSFCSQPNCADGSFPEAPLVQGADGNFYGTTQEGGNGTFGGGTVFKVSPSGALTTLHMFGTQPSDGSTPVGGLVQATDGNFYGTTSLGGSALGGEIFSINPQGTLTNLYGFCSQPNCADGSSPYDSPVQGTNGTFYGLTARGGVISCDPDNAGCGTVFSLSLGLRPFVETRPTSGKAGKKVIVLGTNLTGATGVSFNGTAATFNVISSTEITAKVPKHATTGLVTVTTPDGNFASNVPFIIQ